MKRIAMSLVALGLLVGGATVPATAEIIYASFNSSSFAGDGVTVRDGSFNQQSFFNTPFEITGISSGGPNNDVFLSSGNNLYRYDALGNQITSFTYTPDPALIYNDISVRGGTVLAAFNSSSFAGDGVTMRNLGLNQLSFFNTPFEIEGLSAGNANDVYLSAANSLYRYDTAGNLLNSFTYIFDPGLVYSDISVGDSFVFASFNSSSFAGDGVTVRDSAFNQLSFFNTPFEIEGIAAGHSNDIYLSSANSLYRYDIGGNLIESFTYTPDSNLVYSDITAVPEPGALALFCAGLLGLRAARRRDRAA